MARVLIVGCGCRGQALARELVAAGHAVRGTTRDPDRLAEIAAAGAEPVQADPDRIATLMGALAQTTILCWLLGTASGSSSAEVAALHGPRLRMLFEKIVDTPVRGVVYEAGGTVGDAAFAEGRSVARAAHETWQIPLEILDADPSSHKGWLAEATLAVDRLLTG